MTDFTSYPVEFVNLQNLHGYPENARVHSAKQVEEIAASIIEFGWTNPVLVDAEGTIFAGHGRRDAATLIYNRGQRILLPDGRAIPDWTVPAIRCEGWSDNQKQAYVLADNQLALNASWDYEKLSAELRELKEDGFELELIGFSPVELEKALKPPVAEQISDGVEGGETETGDAADGSIRVGPYRGTIDRADMEAWLTIIRTEGGDDKDAIFEIIKSRLGF